MPSCQATTLKDKPCRGRGARLVWLLSADGEGFEACGLCHKHVAMRLREGKTVRLHDEAKGGSSVG